MSGEDFTTMEPGPGQTAAEVTPSAMPSSQVGSEPAANNEEQDSHELPDTGGWQMVLTLFSANVLALGAYLALFSELGFGATLFKALMKTTSLYAPVAALGFLLLVVFYICDFDLGFRAGNYTMCALITCCMVLATVMCFDTMPHAPLMSFMVTIVGYFGAIYVSLYKGQQSPEGFIKTLSKACLVGGALCFLAACVWAGINDCWWGKDCKTTFRDRLRVCPDMSIDGPHCKRYGTFGTTCQQGCEEDAKLSVCKPTDEYCLAAFMLWVSPFLVAILMVVFGVAMYVISNAAIESRQHTGEKSIGSSRQMKLFRNAVGFVVLVLWIGASLAGASMQLSKVVTQFATLSLLLIAGVMAVAVGTSKLKSMLTENKYVSKLTTDPFWSDLAKGMGVCFSPVLFLFLPVAFLKRAVRKARSAPVGADVEAGLANSKPPFREVLAYKVLHDARSWRWTTILCNAWLLCFAYFAFQAIVMTMTTLFMAWLNLQLAGLHWAVIAITIMLIGLVLFAIPVVPGVPAYLACGVILGAAEDQFGDFAVTMVVAMAVAIFTKLLACLMQQKLFGEMLGRSLWVRSTLGVNEPGMKAINLILQEKGLTAGKVAILVGGPDWPTSVLTGVLHCSALQMQAGTLPVLIPIAFIVLTGGAMLKSGQYPESLWVPLSGVFMSASAALQAFIGVMAIKYVNQTLKERKDEIAAIPDDDEVAKFDESQKKAVADRKAAMEWGQQTTPWRACLGVSVATAVISCWVFYLFKCFEDVVLTTDIRQPPFHGNFLKVFKLYGWVGLAFMAISCLCYGLFRQHIKAQVKHTTADPSQLYESTPGCTNRVDQEPADSVAGPVVDAVPAPGAPPAAAPLPVEPLEGMVEPHHRQDSDKTLA